MKKQRRGWAQSSSLSVMIQHAHFSIASEILQNQTREARVRRDPAGDKLPDVGAAQGHRVPAGTAAPHRARRGVDTALT